MRAAGRKPAQPTLYVPAGSDAAVASALRAEGFATLAGLAPVSDARAEAMRLNCTHVLINGHPEACR